jgi:hypothetical protein
MFVAICAIAASASTTAVTVQGYMNPWLAGMPDGSTAKGDTAPAESPILALTGFSTGSAMQFSTSSTCGFAWGGGCGPYSGPANSADGDLSGGYTGAANGMSGMNTPWNALVGVFLNNTEPDLGTAPADLSFLDINGNPSISFASLSPALGQVFFIGDGLTGTGSGSIQDFYAPTGATRLFLGSTDGSGWYNNGGYQDVTITYSGNSATPEPGTMIMFGSGILGLAGVLRRKINL